MANSDVNSKAPVLEVRSLVAGYGDLIAVREVSFQLHAGEVVALFGANGAGKSTTMLAACGALPRLSGEVLWQGVATTNVSVHRMVRNGLAFVPEQRSVISGLNVRDNLRLGSGGVKPALEFFPELAPLLGRRAGLLSGGEQQMLTLARALAMRPKALLVDEVSLGLAPLVVERLLSALRTAADTYGIAVLIVEQQARRALAVADRWHLLANGVLTESGSSDAADALEVAYQASIQGRIPAS